MSTVKVVERVDPREIRRKLGLNQQQFWSKIGVTQSGGSRYESGRNMPKPVRELLRLVHVEQIDIQRLKARRLRGRRISEGGRPRTLQDAQEGSQRASSRSLSEAGSAVPDGSSSSGCSCSGVNCNISLEDAGG
jgi:transcriptional regulator with XRE-family HTH domain